ncbi:MAG: RICIN domain-containing protein [Nitrospirae bacterium]|nr:RICIN domain-containing protein [Nitrospirota bacterium]
MKRAFSMVRFSGLVVVLFAVLTGVVYGGVNLRPEEINASIEAAGAQWHAGETSVSGLTYEQKRRLCGTMPSASGGAKKPALPLQTGETPPASLDWRNNYGNWVTDIRDQGNCGSCWAFSTTAALESYSLMKSNSPGADNNTPAAIDLSEQVLLSCGGAGDCENGGYLDRASDFLRNTGLPSESCYPYTHTDGSCSKACSNRTSSSSTIKSWQWVSATVSSLKDALGRYGPLVVSMEVYDDFYYYKSGIYSYTSGGDLGGHAILLVGYNDAQQYFIVKNQWGKSWGEQGYFRIAYSQVTSVVQFGAETIAYGTVPIPPNHISPSGTITTSTPAYTWNAVYGATQYALSVYDSTGNAIPAAVYTPSAAGCSSGTGTCSITPSKALASGSASWYVAAGNSVGWGAWTNAMTFTVSSNNTVPAAPTLASPSGTITTTTPNYTWNAVSGATQYALSVYDSTGNTIPAAIYSASAVGCSSGTGTCSITPSKAVAGSSASWYAAAGNTIGWGAWSSKMSFTVSSNNTVPAAPTPVSPSSTITTTTPTYTWNAVSGATQYALSVYDSTGKNTFAVYSTSAVGCSSGTGTCSITPSTVLPSGNSSFYVAAGNAVGWGAWSSAKSFTVASASTIYYEIVNRASGLCIEPYGTGAGSLLQLNTCSGTANQNFSLPAGSVSGYYKIVNKTSGLCMGIKNGSSTSGIAFELNTCNGTDNQNFSLPAGSVSGYYKIVNKTSSKCVDVPYTTASIYDTIEQFSCVYDTQDFSFTQQ